MLLCILHLEGFIWLYIAYIVKVTALDFLVSGQRIHKKGTIRQRIIEPRRSCFQILTHWQFDWEHQTHRGTSLFPVVHSVARGSLYPVRREKLRAVLLEIITSVL